MRPTENKLSQLAAGKTAEQKPSRAQAVGPPFKYKMDYDENGLTKKTLAPPTGVPTEKERLIKLKYSRKREDARDSWWKRSFNLPSNPTVVGAVPSNHFEPQVDQNGKRRYTSKEEESLS